MERSPEEIPRNSHDEYEATEDTMGNSSQTQHRQSQPVRHQSSVSQPCCFFNRLLKMIFPEGICRFFNRLMEMFSPKGMSQTSRSSEGGNIPYTNPIANRTDSRTSGEGDHGSQSRGADQHEAETYQAQDQEPRSADESDVIDCDDSKRSNGIDCDLDHPILAKKNDIGNSSQWCSICQEIEEWIIQGDGDQSFNFGTWADVQARAGCPSCDDMLGMPSGTKPIESHVSLRLTRNDFLPEPYAYSFEIKDSFDIPLNFLDRVMGTGHMGNAVDQNWFDIARLQKWLAFCDENHGEECHGLPLPHEYDSTRPRCLIDVAQGCLVESRGDEQYFALSYVWGPQQATGMATKRNINLLMQKGTITTQNATFRLPRTVEDAIRITELLGGRFLWIDRLCIVQDDLANWHSEIIKMGSIYANAYCTFVASGGSDADHGLAGLSEHSGPRQMLQRRIRFPSLQMIEMDSDDATWTSIWNERGWTFQELKLSRRALFFNNHVRWKCHQSEWQEDISAEPEGIESRPTSSLGRDFVPLSVGPWPDFAQWWNLIAHYSKRQFRFESDAGAAFAGIEEILGYSFPGGFCFGMPEFYFDIALLWTPCGPMQRRDPKYDGSYLPSWSFLGWKGGFVNPTGPVFAYEWLVTLDNGTIWNTSSIVPKVDWIQKGPCGQERRIRNDYHMWKQSQNQLSPEAQTNFGWRKEGTNNVWAHPSIPNVVFRYPVPLGFQTVTHEYHAWSASLRLRSQSTFLKTSDSLDVFRSSAPSLCTELVTRTGEWAGILHLNTYEAKDVPLGEVCELVALSCGSVSNHDENAYSIWLEEWSLDGRPKASEKYEFYNVMWIRREDTYVVRENIGRVEKSVWDSQELQDIDVELR